MMVYDRLKMVLALIALIALTLIGASTFAADLRDRWLFSDTDLADGGACTSDPSYGYLDLTDLDVCRCVSSFWDCNQNGSGAEINDLTAAVVWATVPDANVAGVDERDEVCNTNDLDASCEINVNVLDAEHVKPYTSFSTAPNVGVSQCFWANFTGTGGCIVCEGDTADAFEQAWCFPDINGTDSTDFIATHSAEVIDMAGSGLQVIAGVLSVIGGSGDVSGPSASVDNSIARYQGTTGKEIQDYTSNDPTISDAGFGLFPGGLHVPDGSTSLAYGSFGVEHIQLDGFGITFGLDTVMARTGAGVIEIETRPVVTAEIAQVGNDNEIARWGASLRRIQGYTSGGPTISDVGLLNVPVAGNMQVQGKKVCLDDGTDCQTELPLTALADLGDLCPGGDSTRRNGGDSANECYTPASADGVGYDEIFNEGSGITKRAILNFIGASVDCVDNASRSECTFTPENNATADQTDTEIRDAVEAASNSNTFNDTDHTNLNNQSGSNTGDNDEVPLTALADLGDLCAGLESTRRNAGDDANECFTPSAGGEVNTLGSPDVGSDLDLINSVPKTGSVLNLISLEADDFNLGSNIVTIDDGKWATDAELAAQDECSEITNCTPSAILAADVTYENLDANSDIGFGSAQVPQGSLAAPLAGPALTGTPTAPTAATANDSTQIATTAFVKNQATTKCKTVEFLVAADDDVPLHAFLANSTITGIACHSSAATTISMQDQVGNDIDADLVCSTGTGLTFDTSFTGAILFSTGEILEFDTVSASTPTWTIICFVSTTP